MLTPLAQPFLLMSMNSSAVPCVQVAIMRPSSNQTVLNRSQCPASRQTAQLSTSWRIANWSSSSSFIFPHLTFMTAD